MFYSKSSSSRPSDADDPLLRRRAKKQNRGFFARFGTLGTPRDVSELETAPRALSLRRGELAERYGAIAEPQHLFALGGGRCVDATDSTHLSRDLAHSPHHANLYADVSRDAVRFYARAPIAARDDPLALDYGGKFFAGRKQPLPSDSKKKNTKANARGSMLDYSGFIKEQLFTTESG